ncbi:MAG TPA: aldehyde dehydrogenase family protein [Solirubrobacteraceae bacterium]|nr:aldehyde dehydrogenase family protein [Solirubrobacteraceae bacterium]
MHASAPDAAPTVEAHSAVTGERLGTLRATTPRGAADAARGAQAVQRLWAELRPGDRARYMARAAQAVIDEFDELAGLLAAEQGRPRAEAEVMELLAAVETLQWLAEEGPRILAGQRIGFSRTQHPVKRGRWTYEPLGVVAVLGAAAEPFATPLGDVAVALMAGNGVVLKPSPHAALAGERVARVLARAGLPEGLLRVAHGHADVGGALVEAPAVAQVRFTGSARAGRAVGEACARGLKRSVLELGGKDAMLVLADANVARAARGAAWAAFANAGQCGGSVERVFVLRDVADRFLAALVGHARTLRVGDPRDPDVEIGPLVSRERAGRVRALVDEAVADGATLHCGGALEPGPDGLAGAFYAPAVLTGVPDGVRLAREEVPGPVLVVSTVDDEDDAIARANDVDLALGASVWTADRPKGERIAHELRASMVWMNDHLVARTAPQVPWGGVGGSGVGRARGAIALRTCAEPKVVTWDPPIGRPAWWFPYDRALARAARGVAGLRSARDADRDRALREDALPLARVTGRWLRALRSGR